MRARFSSLSANADHQASAREAASLSASIPLIAMEARRLAASVSLGLHGRGRAGPGESFWQYRALIEGEPQTRIDWRKSARHGNALFVREHEWEAARSFHIFIDQSSSMNYSSDKHPRKIDHAVIMGLALADLLVRSGERVALFNETPPSASRQIIDRLAEVLSRPKKSDHALPEITALSNNAHVIIIGDMIAESKDIEATLSAINQSGAHCTLLRILDPAEIDFPFSGETELMSAETALTFDIGDAASFAPQARARLDAHERELKNIVMRHRSHLATHRTDEAMTPCLLALMTRFSRRDESLTGVGHG